MITKKAPKVIVLSMIIAVICACSNTTGSDSPTSAASVTVSDNAVLIPANAASVSATADLAASGSYNPETVDSVSLSFDSLAAVAATLHATSGSWTATIPSASLATLSNGSKTLVVAFSKGGSTVKSLSLTIALSGSSVSSGHAISGTVKLPAGLAVTASSLLGVYIIPSGSTSPSQIISPSMSSIGYSGAAMSYSYIIKGVADGTYTLGALVDKDGDFDTQGDFLASKQLSAPLTMSGADLAGEDINLDGRSITIQLSGAVSWAGHLLVGGVNTVNGVANKLAGGSATVAKDGSASIVLIGSGNSTTPFEDGQVIGIAGLIDLNDDFAANPTGPDSGDAAFSRTVTVSGNTMITLTTSDLTSVK